MLKFFDYEDGNHFVVVVYVPPYMNQKKVLCRIVSWVLNFPSCFSWPFLFQISWDHILIVQPVHIFCLFSVFHCIVHCSLEDRKLPWTIYHASCLVKMWYVFTKLFVRRLFIVSRVLKNRNGHLKGYHPDIPHTHLIYGWNCWAVF